MSLPEFEAASLGVAATAMRSPAGWVALAAFVAADVAVICGVEALESPVIAIGLVVPAWLAWCWLCGGREGRAMTAEEAAARESAIGAFAEMMARDWAEHLGNVGV